MRRSVTPVAVTMAAWLVAAPAQALYVDYYTVSTSLRNVKTDASNELGPTEDLGLFNRQLVVNGAGSTDAAIVIDAAAQTATFLGNSAFNPSGRIVYTPTAGAIDLSAPGTTLDFIFDGVVGGSGPAVYDTSVVVRDGTLTDTASISSSSSPAAPGPITLPLSDFTVDASAVTEISLEFLAGSGQEIGFSAPADAPAAPTLPLLAAGTGLLAWSRRRRGCRTAEG